MKRFLHHLNKIYLPLLGVMGVLAVVLAPSQAGAAAASISLSSSSSSVQKDATFVVNVTVNTSGTVSDALVKLTYNPSQISYVSASFSGSPLDSDLGSGAGTGSYTADRYKLGAPFPNGGFTLVRVTFRALQSSGSASISVSNGESTIGDGSNGQSHTPLTSSGTSVTLTSPPSTPAPTTTSSPTSNGNNSNTIDSNDSDTPKPSDPKPIADDEPVEVDAERGPGIYVVGVTVLDEKGDHVSGVEVKLGEMKAQTNEFGRAEFANVAAGEYTLSAGDTTKTIWVEAAEDATKAQEFELVQSANNPIMKWLIPIGVGLVVVAAVAALLVRSGLGRPKSGSTASSAIDKAYVGDLNSKPVKPQSARVTNEVVVKPSSPSPADQSGTSGINK